MKPTSSSMPFWQLTIKVYAQKKRLYRGNAWSIFLFILSVPHEHRDFFLTSGDTLKHVLVKILSEKEAVQITWGCAHVRKLREALLDLRLCFNGRLLAFQTSGFEKQVNLLCLTGVEYEATSTWIECDATLCQCLCLVWAYGWSVRGWTGASRSDILWEISTWPEFISMFCLRCGLQVCYYSHHSIH